MGNCEVPGAVPTQRPRASLSGPMSLAHRCLLLPTPDGLRGAAGPGHTVSVRQGLKLGSSFRNGPTVAILQHVTRNAMRKQERSCYGPVYRVPAAR